jgi:hypothetical protein
VLRRALVAAGGVVAGSIAGWVVAGCGAYSFTPSRLPAHIRTVAIPVFQNVTTEPGLEQEITQQITREFVSDNTLQVVPEARADAGIYGRIVRYENRVFGYDAKGETQQYEVIVEVAIEFKDLVKRKTLWKEESMVGRSTYYVVATTGQLPQDEVSGRTEAIRLLAADILNRTVRSWN